MCSVVDLYSCMYLYFIGRSLALPAYKGRQLASVLPPLTSAEADRSVYLWFWERYIYQHRTSTTSAFFLARKLYLSPSSHQLPSNERTSKHILLSTISSPLALILDMLRATRHRQDKRPIDRMSESEVKSKLLLSDKTIAELDHA
jgi:hypothetical protein